MGIAVGTVTHDARIHVFGRIEEGGCIVVPILVLQQVAPGIQEGLHVVRELVRGIGRRGQRVQLEGGEHGGTVVGTFGDAAGLVVFHLVVGLDFEPGLELPGAVHHEGDALVHIRVTHEHTVVVQVGGGDVQVAPVVAGGEGEVVVLHQGILIGIGQPVGVGLEIPVGVEILDIVAAVLDEVLHVLLGIHHLGHVVQALGGQLIGVADLAFTLTAAGGDHDDTVTGLGTVDGGGSTVLEDFHGLDVVGVDTGDGVGAPAIHHIQGIGRTVGGDTADLDARGSARTGGIGEHLDTGRLALESGFRRGDRTVLDVLGFHLGDGARDIGFLLDAVTHDNRFLDHLGVKLHLDFQVRITRNHIFLRQIADGRDNDGGSLGNDEAECTVKIGNSAVGGAFLHHAGGDHRLILLVKHPTRDDRALRERRHGGRE